jgi:anaerobic ribonucleoside-triphosphate reductase activating protein
MKKYAGLNTNDFANGQGVCVSYFVQGCPHRCQGCFNPETWDFEGGLDRPDDIRGQIIKAICANGITRNFSVLGGEPLCEENLEDVENIILGVRTAFPNIKIFVWTGYTLEQLTLKNNEHINNILNHIDVLIDGPFIESQKDLTLELRGSKNQRILYKGIDF